MIRNNLVIIFIIAILISGCNNKTVLSDPVIKAYSDINIQMTWPGSDNMKAAPPVELDITTIEVVLINSNILDFNSELYSNNAFPPFYLSQMATEFPEECVFKEFNVRPGSDNENGCVIDNIPVKEYFVGVLTKNSSEVYSVFYQGIINIGEGISSPVTISSDDWETYSDGGELYGKVTDDITGSPVAGALVVADGTQIYAVTDDSGNYSLTGLTTGYYTIIVTVDGYVIKTISNIFVD